MAVPSVTPASMALFQRIPERLFGPLASQNRHGYWALLCHLHRRRFGPDAPLPPSYGFLQREITQEIEDHLKYADEWQPESGDQPDTPLNIRAIGIFNRLVDAGWFRLEKYGIEKTVNMAPAVGQLLTQLINFAETGPVFVSGKIRAIDAAVAQVHNRIRQAVQSLSSPETLRLLLGFAGQLTEALAEKEFAQQRISGSTSAEYQALCAKLQALQGRKPQLESEARTARDEAVRSQTILSGLLSDCQTKLEELQGARTNYDACRGHADYDSDFASNHWDRLLEQFGENYQAMAANCETNSKRCNAAVLRHVSQAQSLLGTFLTDHREAVSEEVISDWRKSKAWMEQQIVRLKKTELPQYTDQAKEAYLASQNTFRQDVALALHANLKYQTTTFKRLNDALKASPAFTNGERYQFQAKVRPDLMPLKKFIENIADFGADGGLFGEPGEIPAQFAELLREKTTTGNAAVKSPLDDYREFFEFDIEIETDDPVTGVTKTIGHLSKRIGPGSGGEHRAPLYVIAGAALSSAYRMDENNQDGLRLILLDEAFDKMDTPNIVATMRYLEKLGLQVLLASPGENLPTLTAFLHRYFEIMKDETRHVIQVEERRVSEAMREQFREDMWEYHPELLEAEMLAVRQEPIARPVAAPAP